ncbi:hypothetical protein ES707_22170 [subsurface metagenome]
MKKLLLFIVILISIILITGCTGTDSNFTIKVSGTTGLRFSGSYLTIKADGENISKSVDGVVPSEYRTKGAIVSCMFQKQEVAGHLIVEILKEGKTISQSDTTAEYGCVTIATK